MNFSRISDNSLLGQILRLPLNLIPPGTIMPILQGRLRGKKWIVWSSDHGYWLGSYENKKRIVFEEMINNGAVVFDLGAHVGFYSLLASILVGPKGMVYSFEPVPKNIYYLKRHLQLNNIRNVTVVEAAVSDTHGSSKFFLDESNRIYRSRGRISSNGNLIVKTVSLDQLYKQGNIPIPNYIKIDVEGAEMLVFLGARKILSNFHPTIFLATHGELIRYQCCDFLKSIGYKLEAINGRDVKKSDELIAYCQCP